MVGQGRSVGVEMTCVPARDRLDCLNKLHANQADWMVVDPEDVYIAAKKFNDSLSVFKEIRTKEEPDGEFRYEGVVVIHKNLNIERLEQLQGLKSCFTGVGRIVGYKAPIKMLTKLKILPTLNDTKLSQRENELKALSTFFSKSCVVGQWSPFEKVNRRLKQQYHNLCELCQFPKKCDYPDKHSSYEGALRCLVGGGGDVAFTKALYTKRFFGVAYGTKPATKTGFNPNDYLYLCPDASKKPVTGTPCHWGARPWQGYLSSVQDQQDVAALREAITKLNDLGEQNHAEWISSVLALNNKTLARDNNGPYKPQHYLEKAKYFDMKEFDWSEPHPTLRLCTTSEVEVAKCKDLSMAAVSRNIYPKLECVPQRSLVECLTKIEDSKADIVFVEPGLAVHSISKFPVAPVLKEVYENDHKTSAIAVVKKSSPVQSWGELKGRKACSSNVGEAAGWVVPVHQLMMAGLIDKNNCTHTKALLNFFSTVNYSDDPLKCLVFEEGDVAFMDYDTLLSHVDGGEKATDYELLCADGGREPLDQYLSCRLATVPPKVVLAREKLLSVEKDRILSFLLSSTDLFHMRHPEYFDLFATYNNHSNVLFSNSASGLDLVQPGIDPLADLLKLHIDLKTCVPQELL